MLAATFSEKCNQCSGNMIDADEELVCTSCGSVMTKEVIETREERRPQAIDYTNYSLGSYLGPQEYGCEERFSKGFSRSSSTFKYLKTISDYSCRDESSVYTCARMIERVCEKLSVPKTVLGQAMRIAKSITEMRRTRGEFTAAVISTFSLITACKIYGITSVSVKEIVDAHRDMGHRVKISTIIRMSIDAPVKTRARRAEEYLRRVAAHLSSNELLKTHLRERGINETAYCNDLYEVANEILAMIDGLSRGGHNPSALAATSVYAAEVVSARMQSRKKFFTQRDIAQCNGVAEYTVREQYGEIFRPRMERICDAIIQRMSRNQRDTTKTFPIPLQMSPRA